MIAHTLSKKALVSMHGEMEWGIVGKWRENYNQVEVLAIHKRILLNLCMGINLTSLFCRNQR